MNRDMITIGGGMLATVMSQVIENWFTAFCALATGLYMLTKAWIAIADRRERKEEK